ncbi:uncharacterized protein [Montipora capricornis]|uniref:uncharacterized protein n=1 Tax=Montipora capricornis TaxID=246305 RepID=UPI0035F149A1
MLYRGTAFNVLIQSYLTRWHVVSRKGPKPVTRILQRGFTGKVFSWSPCNVLKNRGILEENIRLVPLVIPSASSSFSPIELAKGIAAVKKADGFLDLYSNFKKSSAMTRVNRITILHNLAKFAVSSPKKNFTATKKVLKEQHHVFLDLLQSIAADFGKCKPRDLASIVWALGKLRENVVWFVTECEKEIIKQDEKSIMPPAVCQLLNGFASLNLKRSQFFSFVEQRILEEKLNLKDFENRGLCGILWSFVKTENGSIELYKKIKDEISQRDVKSFNSQQLGQILWAFNEREIPCEELCGVIVSEIRERSLADQTNEGIKVILRSLAKIGPSEKDTSDLFSKLGEEVLSRGIHDFDTGDLVMLAWSFAKMCPKMEVIFDFLEEEITLRKISDFRNHELSLLLWSFAKADYLSDDLFTTCQEEILSRNFSFFKAEQLSQLAWAFGRSAIPTSEFYHQLEKQITGNMRTFSNNELCMIARGFAQASAGTPKLFKEIEKEVLDQEIVHKKPDFIPELALIFSKCSYKAPLLFDEMEKVLKHQERHYFNSLEVKIINSAFSKAGKELQFVQYKSMGRHNSKLPKRGKDFHLNSKNLSGSI